MYYVSYCSIIILEIYSSGTWHCMFWYIFCQRFETTYRLHLAELKTEAASLSKKFSKAFQTTRRHIPEHNGLHGHRMRTLNLTGTILKT